MSIDPAYQQLHNRAVHLETTFKDLLTSNNPTAHVLQHEAKQLVEDIEAKKNPRDLENRIKIIQHQMKQVEHQEARMVHRLRSVADFYRNRLQRNSAWVKLLMPVVLFIVIGGGCVLLYAAMTFWPVTELYRNLGN